MRITDIEYRFHGLRLVGLLAVDDTRTGKRPAVLVSHDAGGLDDHAKHTAHRLANLGYVAFALDYYGGGERLPPGQVGDRFGELAGDVLRTRALGRAGLEVLLANEYVDTSKVAAIGYCFGGTLSLELARDGADLPAIVGFHSGLSTSRPEDAARIAGKVLVCLGAEDPLVPPQQRLAFEEEMRAAGVDWQLHLYGDAVHSFTNPAADGSNPAINYNRRADERSWRAMLDLFAEVFLTPPLYSIIAPNQEAVTGNPRDLRAAQRDEIRASRRRDQPDADPPDFDTLANATSSIVPDDQQDS